MIVKMEEKNKKSETNVEIWKKHQEKEAKGLKKNIYIYFFSNCIVLCSKIDLVAINYLTLLCNKRKVLES